MILAASNDLFSGAHTGSLLRTALEAIFGSISTPTFETVHFSIRKLSHLTEYAILGALLFRAFRAGKPGWLLTWARNALIVASLIAIVDELHQSTVPSRSGSAVDVAIDVGGAALAQWLIRLSVNSSQRLLRKAPAE